MKRLPTNWAHVLANVDYQTRLALVIDRSDADEVVAVGRYEPTSDPTVAEVAFVVQDGWQGKGLGRVLLRELLTAAEARGIRRFRAYVLAGNQRMLRLLAHHTRIIETKIEQGEVSVLFEPADSKGRGG